MARIAVVGSVAQDEVVRLAEPLAPGRHVEIAGRQRLLDRDNTAALDPTDQPQRLLGRAARHVQVDADLELRPELAAQPVSHLEVGGSGETIWVPMNGVVPE